MNGEIPMKKKALLAVLLAMTLLLSSCALVVKDPEVDAKSVILKMGDKEITKAEVQAETNEVLYNMYVQYQTYYGYTLDVTNKDVIADAQSTAVENLKRDMALEAKAAELGFDQLTEEDLAHVQEHIESDKESARSYIKIYGLVDDTLEGEELEKATLEQMEALGATDENLEKLARNEVIMDKLQDSVTSTVTVSDDEVKADYDSKVAADEEKYKENLASWASADRNGTKLYYAPEGVRRVKQILLKFKSDDQTAIDDAKAKVTDASTKISDAQKIIDNEEAAAEDKAKAEEDKKAAEAELETAQAAVKEATDKAFANLDEDANALLASLKEDPESWDKLQEEKNEDPGMKPGAVNAEKGYAVFSGMTDFDSAFVDAAMGLAAIGDTSDKIRGESYGYYVIKYVGDVTPGAVDYESVKDTLHDSLLSSRQSDTWNTTVDTWIKEAGIKEDLGALKD